MSFQIGIPHLLIIILALLFVISTAPEGQVEKSSKARLALDPSTSLGMTKSNALFLLIIFFLVLFFITPFSLPLWKLIPGLSFFQYPWRFLSLVIFITSFLSAWVAHLTNKKWLAILLLILALLCYYPYTKPVVYRQRQDSFYLNNPTWTLGTDSPGNSFNTIWFKSNNVLGVKSLNRTVNIAYFPGWQVYVDQTPQKIYPNREGLISFSLAKGQHLIETKFEDTPIRTWAKYISALSLILLIITFVRSKYRTLERGIYPKL